MPMYNRSATTYQELASELGGGKLKDAKLTASLNIVVPKGISKKKVDQFLNESHREMEKAFKKFIKKENEKAKKEE